MYWPLTHQRCVEEFSQIHYSTLFMQVLNYAREYYSCPNLQGVLLENEGGNGSARYANIQLRNDIV